MLTMQDMKAFVMRRGRLSASMCSPWHMGQARSCPTMAAGSRPPGVAIVSCNDGLRPVIMKLEATDEDAKIEYTPIDR